jgi:DNA-binding XRE family transcriptional regulator
MAKKQEEGSREPVKVLLKEQVEKVNWAEPEKYDFFDTPHEIRELLVPSFLSWAYETYRREMYDKHNKQISQNHFAVRTIGIDAQTFSMYKNGLRYPSMQNADLLAEYFGTIIYDVCGFNRRMPHDRFLYSMSDIWDKLDERMRKELLERANNYVDNQENKAGGIHAAASET